MPTTEEHHIKSIPPRASSIKINESISPKKGEKNSETPKVIRNPSSKTSINPENKQEEVKIEPWCNWTNILIVVLVISLAIIFFEEWREHSKVILEWIKQKISALTGQTFPMNYVYIILVYQAYLIFMFPGFHLFTILLSFTMHSFIQPFCLLMVSHFISATILYVVIEVFFHEWFGNKLKSNRFYKFVVFESRKSPYTVGLMIRWVSVPYPLKNTLVALGKVGYPIYIATLYPNAIFQAFLMSYIGMNLHYIDEIFLPHKWSSMPSERKLTTILTYLTFLITITILCFICFYTKKKMRDFELKMYHRKEQETLRRLRQANIEELSESNGSSSQEMDPNQVVAKVRTRLDRHEEINEIENDLEKIQEVEDEDQSKHETYRYPRLSKYLEDESMNDSFKPSFNGSLINSVSLTHPLRRRSLVSNISHHSRSIFHNTGKNFVNQNCSAVLNHTSEYLETEERGILDTERDEESPVPVKNTVFAKGNQRQFGARNVQKNITSAPLNINSVQINFDTLQSFGPQQKDSKNDELSPYKIAKVSIEEAPIECEQLDSEIKKKENQQSRISNEKKKLIGSLELEEVAPKQVKTLIIEIPDSGPSPVTSESQVGAVKIGEPPVLDLQIIESKFEDGYTSKEESNSKSQKLQKSNISQQSSSSLADKELTLQKKTPKTQKLSLGNAQESNLKSEQSKLMSRVSSNVKYDSLLDEKQPIPIVNPFKGQPIKPTQVESRKLDSLGIEEPLNVVQNLKDSFTKVSNQQKPLKLPQKDLQDISKLAKNEFSVPHTPPRSIHPSENTIPGRLMPGNRPQTHLATPSRPHHVSPSQLERSIENISEGQIIDDEECRTPVKPTLPSKKLKQLGLLSTEKKVRQKESSNRTLKKNTGNANTRKDQEAQNIVLSWFLPNDQLTSVQVKFMALNGQNSLLDGLIH